MAEKKKDDKAAKIATLKARACDMFTQDIRLNQAKNQNSQALQQILNQIEQLEKE
jgi:hypothetical protein